MGRGLPPHIDEHHGTWIRAPVANAHLSLSRARARTRDGFARGPPPPRDDHVGGAWSSPAELQEARIRSGRPGGRPRKPTLEEARRAALDELVPKALRVLNEHLDKGGPDAWRAALRVFEHAYGRAPEQPDEPFVMPTTIEEVEKLSWG
jgi:hypothetical protein